MAAKAKKKLFMGRGNKINRARITRYVAYKKWPNTPKYRGRAKKQLVKRYENRKDPMTEDVSISEQAPFRQMLFGRCRCGGSITFIELTTNNQALLMIITLAGHEITSVNKIFFDDEEVQLDASGNGLGKYLNIVHMEVNLGSPSQTALAGAVADSNGYWTANHRQMGCAHVYLKLIWDDVIFQAGIPDITFEVDGYKCAVPDATWPGTKDGQYWRNPVYLVNQFLTDDRIGLAGHWASDIANYSVVAKTDAAYCAASVLKKDGTEPRYLLDQCIFNTGDAIRKILEAMLIPCDGFLVDFGSNWYGVEIMCDRYRTPILTLNENDIIDDLKIDCVPDCTNQVFGIRGSFVNSADDNKESAFPAVYWNIGGSVVMNNFGMDDISLPGVTSQTQAQRLAKQHLYQEVHWIQLSATFSLRCWEAGPTDVVILNLPRYGFVNKTFQVVSSRLVFNDASDQMQMMACEMQLREIDAAIYEWDPVTEERAFNAGQALSFYDTTLPPSVPVGVAAASGSTYAYRRADGTIQPRIYVSWSAMSDAFVTTGGRIEIQHKKSGDNAWSSGGVVNGTDTDYYITDVNDAHYYDVRIRAVNSHNATSYWVTISNIMASGTAVAPGDVAWLTNSIASSLSTLNWAEVLDPDVASYELRHDIIGGGIWSNGIYLGRVGGNTAFMPQLLGKVMVKAVNRSGLMSVNHCTQSTAVAIVDGMPQGLLLALTYNV